MFYINNKKKQELQSCRKTNIILNVYLLTRGNDNFEHLIANF